MELPDCAVAGAALPEPFLRFELEGVLKHHGLLREPDPTHWTALYRGIRGLGRTGGAQRVHNHVVAPLSRVLGYDNAARQDDVPTREGAEDGGWLLGAPGGRLRTWSIATDADLDTPRRAGRAYRFSPTRSAQRVLRASNEQAGLLTDGDTLRLLLCDPAEADSHVTIPLARWATPTPPDSLRLLLALAGPAGVSALPSVLAAARLSQARVTRELRGQARGAIEGFLQAVLDRNPDHGASAADLWAEGLVLVYRLLFILKLESTSDPAHAFSFASTRLWRDALSPNRALGPLVRRHLDRGHNTGRMLEDGLRTLFHVCRDGITCGCLSIAPLGGGLFGAGTTPILDSLPWGERAAAVLLDRLLWTSPRGRPRERVHYGALDVEDLGHIYEALLELEPGIATRPMVRQRRAQLEIVVPDAEAKGDPIPTGRFYLRTGTGRKSSGSYYTPHSLVRLLVRETLGPLVGAASPDHAPDPAAILRLRIVDPAMGSGHFLIEACRFLGDALYAACRLADEAGGAAQEAIDPALAAYLPSRAAEGFAPSRALAICRRLVAVHCLYGADRNPLAVELAKLALWLESYAEGLPLTFLDHRLVAGDAVGGPFFATLETLPVGGQPMDPLLARGVTEQLRASVGAALIEADALNATIGCDVTDLLAKEGAKARLEAALDPLRQLARAWSGAVALGDRDCDDEWQALAASVAAAGRWPSVLTARQAALLAAGETALPWDLTFPEVFQRGGFDAVLSNPPWDVIQHRTEDFVASHDLSVLDAPGRRERAAIESRVLAEPAIARAFAAYKASFDRQKRLAARLFGKRPSGMLDAFHLFAERYLDLGRTIGAILPSAFHANEGATALRRRYFAETDLACLYSFENRAKLFDIDSRFKFAMIVARKPGPTRAPRCAFYLGSVADLDAPGRVMTYDTEFLAASAGTNLAPLELRGAADMDVARTLFANRTTFGSLCEALGIRFGCDLHMTADAGCFVSARSGGLTLHEGKTFHQYTDRWDTAPRYAVPEQALRDKPGVLEAARHPRLVFRDIARATDERTMIAMIAPAGTVFAHTATVEKHPGRRPLAHAQALCALLNSFTFDWLVRQKAATTSVFTSSPGFPCRIGWISRGWPRPHSVCPAIRQRTGRYGRISMRASPAPMVWTARATSMF
jgi:N-6 DNA Methylase